MARSHDYTHALSYRCNTETPAGRLEAIIAKGIYVAVARKGIELEAEYWLTREKPEQVIEAVLDHLLAFNNEER